MSIHSSNLAIAESVAVPGRAEAEQHDRSGSAIVVLDRLQKACDSFLALADQTPASPVELLHDTAAGLHRFATAILACEDAGLRRPHLLPHLEELRALHARSPFVHRLQTWPRGYPGDFETVEWLCEATNRAEAGTVPWGIEQYALQSPVAQQHRNKIGLQARAVLAAVQARSNARIASIGCGGCRDLALVQDFIAGHPASFVLIDADPGALAFARERIGRIAGRCEFIAGRVPRVLGAAAAAGPFDLIVAGGLFDYLPDRWTEATLRQVRRMLAAGGRLLFSNIAAGNPFRPWLEYLAEWRLIERQESDVRRLLTAAGLDGSTIHVFRDTTGLALMVDVVTASASSR